MAKDRLILLLITSLLSCQGSTLSRDLPFDVEIAVNETQEVIDDGNYFMQDVSYLKNNLQMNVTSSRNSIVAALRNSKLPSVEIDRIDLLLQSVVDVGLAACAEVTNDLRSTSSASLKIIGHLQNDLGLLGQADRDLQLVVSKVDLSFDRGQTSVANNLEVMKSTLNEALTKVDDPEIISVVNWHLDNIELLLIDHESDLLNVKSGFDANAAEAVTALDVVIDQIN